MYFPFSNSDPRQQVSFLGSHRNPEGLVEEEDKGGKTPSEKREHMLRRETKREQLVTKSGIGERRERSA
jgi:hypothetical protein